jgi:hypothetical protein
MTDRDTLEHEHPAPLVQYRSETDTEKKRVLFERRYLLRKKWHRMPLPKEKAPASV